MVSNVRELLADRAMKLEEHRPPTAIAKNRGSLPVIYDLGVGEPMSLSSLGDGDSELRTRIGEIFRVNPERVTVTSGATAALNAVVHASCNPGDLTAAPDPGWGEFAAAATFASATVVRYAVDGGVPALEEAMGDAPRGVVVIDNPSNPTGYVMPPAQMGEIIRWTHDRGFLLVVDEVFANFVHRGEFRSALTFAGPNVVVISGVRTWLGTPDLAFGWAISHPQLRRPIMLTAEAGALCLGGKQQATALTAISETNLTERGNEMRGKATAAIALARGTLQDYGVPVADPAGGVSLWVPITATGMTSKEFVTRLLAEEGVQVDEGPSFGPAGEGHVRMKLRFDPDYLEAACHRFARFYARNLPH